MPSVARATLANGLQVIAVRDPIAPVVTTVVTYRIGAEEDPPGQPGMAHAQEHMMFRGSPGLSADQLGEISAAMGGDSDAFTESSDTQYYFTVPAEDLPVALHVEATRMAAVDDADAAWASERGAIEQEVSRDRSDPRYVIAAAARSTLFAGTPDADDGLGTKASFDAMTAAQLKQFYDTWYGPDDAVLVAVGDLDPNATLALARKLFSPIPRRTHPVAAPAAPGAPQGAQLSLRGDQSHASVFLAYRMPGLGSPDYAAGQVLSDVLSDPRSDLHWFPRNWAEGIGFWSDTFPTGGIGYVDAEIPSGQDPKRMVAVLKNNIDLDVKDGLSRRAVDVAKRRAAVTLASERGSVEDYALAWARAVAVLGLSSPEDEVAAIQRVTVDDVDRVASAYLTSNTALVGTLLPAADTIVASRNLDVTGGESAGPVVAHGTPALPGWAQPVLDLHAPTSALAPVDSRLPNGMRLIVQPEPGSGSVIVRGSIAGYPSLEEPQGEEGVDEMLSLFFFEGAADVVDEDWGGELDATGADEFAGRSFGVTVLSTDFDEGMQLLADNEVHPAIERPFFTRIRDEIAGLTSDDLASPDAQAAIALADGLFPSGDPERRLPTKDTIGALTYEEVTGYYASAFRPDLATLVVVGDVTPSTARAAAMRYFGGWTVAGPRPSLALPPVRPNAPSTVVIPASGHVQDEVALEELVGAGRSDPDYYALQLGNHILAGGDEATWLYRDVRQDAGLAYSIDSDFHAAAGGRSTFGIQFGCDPANVSKAKEIALRDVRRLQTAPVDAGDLRQAKLLLLRGVALGEQSQELVADGLLARVSQGLALDEPLRAARRYVSLTAPQVQAAFAKWIRPDGFVEVVEGPPPM